MIDRKTQQDLQDFIDVIKERFKESLSTTKKNIILLAHYTQYRKHFGELAKILQEKYQVIIVTGDVKNDDFEKSGNSTIFVPFRLQLPDNSIISCLDFYNFSEIDCIITVDEVTYENGSIDREFLSKTAKRIYLPHSLLEPTGANIPNDYIIAPSTIALNGYKARNTKAKLLPLGYPKLDTSLKEYHPNPTHTITFAPTLHFIQQPSKLVIDNALIGFNNNLLEWLLDNTDYNISFRVHPVHFQNNHANFVLSKARFSNNPRITFDTNLETNFYNFSDFLITDSSTTAFSYAFTTLKPCFFFAPYPPQNEIFVNANKIGGVAKNLKELKALIDSYKQEDYASKIQSFRDSIVFNFGHSSEAIAKAIDEILA